MLNKFKNKILGSQFIGLEFFSEKGGNSIAMLEIKKKKNELFITHFEKRDDLVNLKSKPASGIPCFVIINNSQVLLKEIDSVEDNDSKLLYNAFPNLKTEDFYYEIWRTDVKAIIAICRKNYVSEIIEKCSENEINICGLSLGVNSLSNILAFAQEKKFQTNSQIIDLNSDQLIKPSDKKRVQIHEINGLEVQDTFLLCFSGMLGIILNQTNSLGNITILNDSLSDSFYQSGFFKKGLRFTVYFLLTILLINFLLFNHYYKKSNNIANTLTANENLSLKISNLEEKIKTKEEKIKTNFSPNNSKSSFIISKLVINIPNSILLSELTYHPLSEKIKADTEIKIIPDEVIISGKTTSPTELTKWIDIINTIKGVKKTIITQFGKNENNESMFSITLKLNSNEIK